MHHLFLCGQIPNNIVGTGHPYQHILSKCCWPRATGSSKRRANARIIRIRCGREALKSQAYVSESLVRFLTFSGIQNASF